MRPAHATAEGEPDPAPRRPVRVRAPRTSTHDCWEKDGRDLGDQAQLALFRSRGAPRPGPGGYALLINRTTADDEADNLLSEMMRSVCDVLNAPASVLDTDWETGGESLFDMYAPHARS